MKSATDANKRILLAQLPKLLQGFANSYEIVESFAYVIIVVCDLDDNDFITFLGDLKEILKQCNPQPKARFCIAIEEGEAWLLGDIGAIQTAYPKAKRSVLSTYSNDSICGTWELLANAIYPGGAAELSKGGFSKIGAVKSEWARKITPHIDIVGNLSPSFRHFKDTILSL